MNEKYRTARKLYFRSDSTYLPAALTVIAASAAFIGATVIFVLIFIKMGDLYAEMFTSIFMSAFIIITGVCVVYTECKLFGFEADLSQVTFHGFFLKRTFRYSEIDSIQVETRYVIVRDMLRINRYLAEKMTIVCGGRKRSFYAVMSYDARSHIQQRRTALHLPAYKTDTALSFGKQLKLEKQLAKEELAEDMLEYSRFHKLKKFIGENQKYL